MEKERRPYLATECEDLKKAEKFRRQILGEVSKKVAQIQNAGLGEFKLRDLNDEINKLLREKGHWEDRVRLIVTLFYYYQCSTGIFCLKRVLVHLLLCFLR